MLESVKNAKKEFTMMELGAGFGRWSVNAVYAIKRLNPNIAYFLVMVEGEPDHVKMLEQNLILF